MSRKLQKWALIGTNVFFFSISGRWVRAMSENPGKNDIARSNMKDADLVMKFRGIGTKMSEDNLEIVYAANFEPANKYRLLPKPLPKTNVAKVVRGPNSGTALAYITPISRSNGKVVYYQLGYAETKGDDVGEFTIIPTTVARFPITIKNLTPGTVYIFKVRATNSIGFNDWSDPFKFMAT